MSNEQTINSARSLIDAFNKHDMSLWDQATALGRARRKAIHYARPLLFGIELRAPFH